MAMIFKSQLAQANLARMLIGTPQRSFALYRKRIQ